MPLPQNALAAVCQKIVFHGEMIARYFTGRVKVSILVRNLDHPDGSADIYVSADEKASVLEAIQKVNTTGECVGTVFVVRPDTPSSRPDLN